MDEEIEKAKEYTRGKGGKFASTPAVSTKPVPVGGKGMKPIKPGKGIKPIKPPRNNDKVMIDDPMAGKVSVAEIEPAVESVNDMVAVEEEKSMAMSEMTKDEIDETSAEELAKAVKHKAKATSEDVEGLISPVLKELEGRVAALETNIPSDVSDAGVAEEMSLQKRIDMAASAVVKAELSEEARLATLEAFYKMTNQS